MALYSAESNRGWVSFKDAEWSECEVIESTETQFTLKLKGGIKTVARTECLFCYRNPSAVEANADFLTLPNLDEPNILHSLRVRYWKEQVYSYTGPILIAVNPWKRVDSYNSTILELHKSGGTKDPHIFGVASKALKELMNSKKNQCVLISGESGSGKTESTKYVLQVLTTSGEKTASKNGVEQQVMSTNPVLEAFGNAKTVRNDNSSRFGKWINVHFDRKSTVTGAEIKTYLLEKARVVQQANDERNYHIFYQVCGAAASQRSLQELEVGEARLFNYTSVCLEAKNTDDAKSFDETKAALHFIGFDAESQANLFATISAILHLGNLAIVEDGEGHAAITDDAHLKAVCKVLQLEAGAVRRGLCSRGITAGGESMVKPEDPAQANRCRDGLAKALYSRLFDSVVKCVNSALRLRNPAAGTTLQASVLDIFGFEVFRVNRFEQFCINHANEKLQLHFNRYNFTLERELYAREGIPLAESDFVDNAASVELLENRAWGIQATLDDVCITPQGDDNMFLERLLAAKELKAHKHFTAPRQRNGTFVVNHYAGSVAYSVEEFCEKNRDVLAPDVVAMMQGSKKRFLVGLFESPPDPAAHHGGGGGRGGRGGGGAAAAGGKPGAAAAKGKSVSATFKADLGSLMESIDAADPHFVRCVNPNAQRKPELFEDLKAIEQLRCGGVIEAVRMCREAYPARYPHAEFLAVFACLCPDMAEVQKPASGADGARRACQALVSKTKVPEVQFRLGATLILLKREAVDELERRRAALLLGRILVLQRTVRRCLSRAVLERRREIRRSLASVLLLQSAMRRAVAGRLYTRALTAILTARKRASQSDDAGAAGAASDAAPSAPASPREAPSPGEGLGPAELSASNDSDVGLGPLPLDDAGPPAGRRAKGVEEEETTGDADGPTLFFENGEPMCGIGLRVDRVRDTGEIWITEVVPGSVAARSKLTRGLVITAINGQSVTDKSLHEVMRMIKGPAGTDVSIEARRPEPGSFVATLGAALPAPKRRNRFLRLFRS